MLKRYCYTISKESGGREEITGYLLYSMEHCILVFSRGRFLLISRSVLRRSVPLSK